MAKRSIVLAEDACFDLRRQCRIPELLLERLADLEVAEGGDLVLRRAIPDGVGAPQDPLRPEGDEELAEHVGRLVGVAHDRPPGRAELGVHVAAGTDTGLGHAAHEAVDALAVGRVGTLGRTGFVARVVDEERQVRMGDRRRTDVDG